VSRAQIHRCNAVSITIGIFLVISPNKYYLSEYSFSAFSFSFRTDLSENCNFAHPTLLPVGPMLAFTRKDRRSSIFEGLFQSCSKGKAKIIIEIICYIIIAKKNKQHWLQK